MKTIRLLLAVLLSSGPVAAQDTFTYQGELLQSGQPADGLFDFEFALFDTPVGGAPIALEHFADDVQVRQGVFTVALGFGSSIRSESELYLQIPGASRWERNNDAAGATPTHGGRPPFNQYVFYRT